MKKKSLCVILILFALCCTAFAEDKYNIVVKYADDMKVSDNIVTLTGNVVLSLKTTTEDKSKGNKERELNAQKIVFNLDEKLLQASGEVHLTEGKDTGFDGDVVSLNWDSLDVIVFSGGSSSDKKNAQGSNVTLFTMGNRVSYEGETQSVFFEKGMVSTRGKDPYWSIRASRIGMSNSDLFFKNATFRIGRVPFFWMPFFFYPGSKLSINPAMGISSDAGMFLNTTYEVYGVYPRLGAASSSSENNSDEDDDKKAALAVFSMLASGEEGETIRDGFSYRKVKNGEKLSKIETWARKTGSYLAIFGDAYEKRGVSMGFETKNKTEDSSIQMDALGLLAYRFKDFERYGVEKMRYSLNMNLSFRVDKSNVKVELPLYSDPYVKRDFLNRNTVFGLDSALGVKQTFPSTYSTDIEDYDINIHASSNHSKNGYYFNVSNLDATVKYKWQDKQKTFDVTEAKLPSFTISSGGTFFNIQHKHKDKEFRYDTDIAQEFADAYADMSKDNSKTPEYSDTGSLSPVQAPAITTSNVSRTSGLKLAYTYSQTFNNFYVKKFKHSYVATTITPALVLSGNASNWFSFSETLNPIYSGTFREGDYNTSNFTLKSTLSASIPVVGLSYNLSANAFIYENKNAETMSRGGNWDKTDVFSHNVSFSKNIKNFTLGVTQTLKPLTEILKPSLSYSYKGFSASADSSFGFEGKNWIEASTSHGSISYSNKFMGMSFSNTIDHTQNNFEGYSGSQSLSLYPLKNGNLRLSENLSLEKEFKPKNFSLGAYYKQNSVEMNFSGEDFKSDTLRVKLNYNIKPFYKWKNRIGFESSMNTGFTYDFNNKFGTQFNIDFSMNFAINKFIDMKINISSINNGFYNYYDENQNFKFSKMWDDLKKSFDFFGDGRKSTNFNLNSMSVSFIHNLIDWNFIMEAKSSIETVNGKKMFKPEITVMVKWNAIPELKVESLWNDQTKEWEKK